MGGRKEPNPPPPEGAVKPPPPPDPPKPGDVTEARGIEAILDFCGFEKSIVVGEKTYTVEIICGIKEIAPGGRLEFILDGDFNARPRRYRANARL